MAQTTARAATVADATQDVLSKTTVDLWPTAGILLDMTKARAYRAAKRGDFPVNRFGRRITVPTAALRQMLGLNAASVTNREAA